MNAKILGISGSPVKDSNTDTLVKAILDATGCEGEFVKLSEHKVGPCFACKKCVPKNECVQNDDFRWLSKKVSSADAFVIGTPVMNMSGSAFTKAFLERLWPFRHVNQLLKGKLAAIVVVGGAGELGGKPVSEWLMHSMAQSGLDVVGSITARGTPACFSCGPGENCRYSLMNTLKKMEITSGGDYGFDRLYAGYLEELPDNDPLTSPSYKIIRPYISVKDQPETIAEAKKIGETIKAKLAKRAW